MMKKNDYVVVNVGFERIHIGHLRMIQEAAMLASNIIVFGLRHFKSH